MPDRVRPFIFGQRDADGDRGGVDPARVDELLARIGTLGARIDAGAQRSVDALRQAQDQPGVETWDRETAESLLDLAARIEAQRRRLDLALQRDRARLSADSAAADGAGSKVQSAMDPV